MDYSSWIIDHRLWLIDNSLLIIARGYLDMPWEHYSKLRVWQKAMDLTDLVYTITVKLPREERFGLYSQMRRAANSIPSNIAEGHGRRTNRDTLQFLSIARGSAFELETQLLICQRQRLLPQDQIELALQLCAEVSRMLSSFILKLS